ncbi:PQQ-binding-like beta-propeller repeat protein [Crateriforma spongiae]|uniref:PQQ-binding-like beta-propeller repeat protein n=1 Tax=Crateriforma spongiae TaxID=2724528 RepID=UPI0039AF1DFC
MSGFAVDRLAKFMRRILLAGCCQLILVGCHSSSESEGTFEGFAAKEPTNASPIDPAAASAARTRLADEGVDLTWSPEGPPLLWQQPMGTGYGSPVIVGDRVIANHRVDDSERTVCFDLESGDLIWEDQIPTTAVCDYEYSDGPYSTPVVAGDDVFVHHGQGQLSAIDWRDGRRIWHRDLYQEYQVTPGIFPAGASPLVTEDRVFLSLGGVDTDAGIIALDRASGETIWAATDHAAAYTIPVLTRVHGNDHLLVVTAEGLVSLDPTDGSVDWEIQHFGRAPLSYNAVSPVVIQDIVLAVTGPGPGAVAVRMLPDRGHERVWKDRRVLDSQFNRLVTWKDHVIGFTAAGQGGASLRMIDPTDGELMWEYSSVLRRGQPVRVGDDIILAIGERGHLASLAIRHDGVDVLAFTDQPLMTEPSYCTPAIRGNRLVLKDEERLAVFDLSAFDPSLSTTED